MQIKVWNQNPSLEQALHQCLAGVPDRNGPYWRLFITELEAQPTVVIHWHATANQGALVAEGLVDLAHWLETAFQNLAGVRQVFLVMRSAGADVNRPFESLAGINRLIQIMSTLPIPVRGVVQEPPGTYGGASLLLASVCCEIWSPSSNGLHLVGKV